MKVIRIYPMDFKFLKQKKKELTEQHGRAFSYAEIAHELIKKAEDYEEFLKNV